MTLLMHTWPLPIGVGSGIRYEFVDCYEMLISCTVREDKHLLPSPTINWQAVYSSVDWESVETKPAEEDNQSMVDKAKFV